MASNGGLEKTVKSETSSGCGTFSLAKNQLREAIRLMKSGTDPFSVALELASVRTKTEEALKQGYVTLESLVQMADVCVQQLLNFYNAQQRMPDSRDLYEKIAHYFGEAVEISTEEVRGTVRAKKSPVTVTPTISYLVTVAEHLISGGLYKMFPPQYGKKFAGACANLGAALGMAGVQDKRLDSLLSVVA